jgi:hypothetical protein
MKKEAMSETGTKHPNEELGGANIFPDKQESIQTYPRGADMSHPDEARPEYQEPEVKADGTICEEYNWPKKGNVKEYPRHE